jgi:predicted DNA-binding protein
MSAIVLKIRVSAYEKRRLQQLAEQNGKTLSDFVREAINEIAADCQDDTAIMKLRRKTAA